MSQKAGTVHGASLALEMWLLALSYITCYFPDSDQADGTIQCKTKGLQKHVLTSLIKEHVGILVTGLILMLAFYRKYRHFHWFLDLLCLRSHWMHSCKLKALLWQEATNHTIHKCWARPDSHHSQLCKAVNKHSKIERWDKNKWVELSCVFIDAFPITISMVSSEWLL